jgi:acylphosphatase
MRRVHLEVHGWVQGVAFRAHTVREARALGLAGWVRNRSDGSVEIVAEGDELALERLRDWCREGPPAARVTRLDERWLDHIGDVGPFTIRYT